MTDPLAARLQRIGYQSNRDTPAAARGPTIYTQVRIAFRYAHRERFYRAESTE